MDQIQERLSHIIEEHPQSISDRKQLRAMLLDVIPQNRLEQNVILNAFDEGITEKLLVENDVTLVLLRTIHSLSKDYGISNDAASWAVITWCYMLGKGEIGTLLEETILGQRAEQQDSASKLSLPTQNKGIQIIGLGMYLAGYDIPEGYVSIKINEKLKSGQIRAWLGRDNKEGKIIADFKDSIAIKLVKGDQLRLELVYSNSVNWPAYTFTLTQYSNE